MSSISTVLIDARELAKPAVNIIVTHPEKKQKKKLKLLNLVADKQAQAMTL